jgi:hypothetical protein
MTRKVSGVCTLVKLVVASDALPHEGQIETRGKRSDPCRAFAVAQTDRFRVGPPLAARRQSSDPYREI